MRQTQLAVAGPGSDLEPSSLDGMKAKESTEHGVLQRITVLIFTEYYSVLHPAFNSGLVRPPRPGATAAFATELHSLFPSLFTWSVLALGRHCR
jgi:hypothetical protein